jgi:hypothetical protein
LVNGSKVTSENPVSGKPGNRVFFDVFNAWQISCYFLLQEQENLKFQVKFSDIGIKIRYHFPPYIDIHT